MERNKISGEQAFLLARLSRYSDAVSKTPERHPVFHYNRVLTARQSLKAGNC
jgi:hypothetical protein